MNSLSTTLTALNFNIFLFLFLIHGELLPNGFHGNMRILHHVSFDSRDIKLENRA